MDSWSACSEKTIKTSGINGRNWDTRYLFLPAKVLYDCCWARWTYWDCDLVFCHPAAPTELWEFLLEEQWCSEVCWTCLASGWYSRSWGWTCSVTLSKGVQAPQSMGMGSSSAWEKDLGERGEAGGNWRSDCCPTLSSCLSLCLPEFSYIPVVLLQKKIQAPFKIDSFLWFWSVCGFFLCLNLIFISC